MRLPVICPWRRWRSRLPWPPAPSSALAGKKLAIVPILRAGLGMVDGILTLIPSAKVGHIGLVPRPADPGAGGVLLQDAHRHRRAGRHRPGSHAGHRRLRRPRPSSSSRTMRSSSIKLMNIIAAPEGIQRSAHRPSRCGHLLCAAVDEKLNDHGYIVPGLGDAGDRIFGTK